MTPRFLHATRRRFLGGTASVAALASLSMPLQAQENLVPLDEYEPTFLNAAEWAFIMAATARIIPSDGDGPGAIETRVPVFIDRQLAGPFGAAADLYMEGPFDVDADPNLGIQSPLTPSEIYREGIAAFDAWCVDNQGGSFADLDAQAQDAALTALSQGEPQLRPELLEFWSLLVQNTKEGYFADPMYGGNAGMQAWLYIGYPGARANYLEWVGRNEEYRLGPVNIAGERA
ncbi:gluconate 2-dehydrogenase subunit 3 family protein [Rhodobacter sp. NTK016B]|uniref:gluconate 2-dehydrogenase subunit 3 family protein n=1 Tax=Rhodobacter sp. NTK016B TaxID=2759676 RepID=UPI001A8C3364|nr:gluconate 2-dehydrogenase subunit 3 family protein [Rhodobacter sp. NTK016B]MBN8293262.1 gluconate 2-dehydrogenase subunit 3 family protein [Rhodobacter sp. NTK016B]